jgi:hypothetical protein
MMCAVLDYVSTSMIYNVRLLVGCLLYCKMSSYLYVVGLAV